MKILFRFPRRLVRWTSLSVSLALILTSLAMVPLPLVSGKDSPTQARDKQQPRNDKARKVEPEPPRRESPAGTWPNLDEVKGRRHPDPEAPAPISSTMRSKRKAPESRRGNTMARIGSAGRDGKTARSHHALARRLVNDTSTSPAPAPGSANDRLAVTWNVAFEPTGSSGDSASSTARIDPFNQTGDPLQARDAEWSLPLVSLPGRAGLDLGLGLSYSSLVWTRAGDYIYFDEDHGTPSPGFRLGFPIVQGVFVDAQAGINARLLITPGGRRIELRQVGSSNIYEAADSSYLQLIDYGSSLLVRSTDGTQMSYAQFGSDWHCTQIKDRNGNYISVNYNGSGDITNITDTLGRVINFNYDGNANLISITQTWNGQTHTWATFGWSTHTMSLGFSVSVVGTYQGETMPVLTQVGLDDGSYFTFQYTGAGQVNSINRYRYDYVHGSATTYDYASTTSDCPRISQMRMWARNWTGVNGVPSEVVTQYSGEPTDSWRQLVAPDGTVYKEFYGTGWQKGLTTQSEVWSGGVRQKWTTAAWTQDNTGVSYQTNPRVTETNIYDASGNRRRTTVGYQTFSLPSGASCSLPNDISEFATDAATVLRRTQTYFETSATYLDRRIIGLPSLQTISDGGGNPLAKQDFHYDWGGDYMAYQGQPVQHDGTNYGAGFLAGRGNLVLTRQFDVNYPNDNSRTHDNGIRYNTAGSVTFKGDASWHGPTVSYADAFSDSVNRNTFAYPTTVTDADGFSSSLEYNYDFGARTRAQRPPPAGQSQGVIQTMTYDSAARVQQLTTTNTGAYTRYVYGPDYVQSFSSVNSVADDAYALRMIDGAGHQIGAANNHPGSSGGYRLVNTIYDQMGRAIKQSNPTEINSAWIPSGDDAAGMYYTQQSYDWKGRPLVTTNTDGTQKYASYGGCGCAGGEVVTLTDEVGRQQKVYSDVLGRTAKAEVLNPNSTVYSTTTNTYNARDQVTLVRQYQGADTSGVYQDTTMTYDGYGRLLTSHAPEQNTGMATSYAYNSDDTVSSVTDARGASATYSYNARHLVTSIDYSAPYDITPTSNVSYGYDAAGNRTSMTDGLGSQSYNYNQLSQMTSETRTFTGVGTYTLGYDYNLAGELKTITSPFSETLNYGFDSTGRLQNITASGYLVTQFLNDAQYRASGTLKSVGYGNGLTETAGYNSRLQMTSRQILQISGQPGVSSTYQYYADGQLKFSHSLDDRFDRAFSYDNVGRTVEAYSGSEARDFNNNTYSGPATGPYRQSYQYDALDQITQQTNRLWSQTQTTYNTFVNNRLQEWSYDADGGLTNDGSVSYTRDAAGRHVQRGMGGTYYGSKFDGDGRLVGTSLTSANGTLPTYYLNSSILGLAVAKLYSNGQKVESYVYAGRRKLATATPWQLVRSHVDPVTGSHGISLTQGFYGADAEFNADGVDVGFAEPTQEEPEFSGFKYPELAGGAGCYPGNPNCVTCFMDGFEQNCAHAGHLMSLGFAAQCPDNDCGPRHDPDRDGPGRGGWIIPRLFPGGFEFEPIGPSSRPPGLTRPTLKTVSPEEAARRKQVVRALGRFGGWGDEGGDAFPQSSAIADAIARSDAQVDAKYAECVKRLGRSPAPSTEVTKAILSTTILEGGSSTLVAVTWLEEGSFSFNPDSNPNDGSANNADIGPMGINYRTFHDWAPLAGLGNVFGTTTTGKEVFNGNAYDNLRAGARILNSYGTGRTAAGRYRAGTGDFSRKPAGRAAFSNRAAKYDRWAAGYDAFFNCLRGR